MKFGDGHPENFCSFGSFQMEWPYIFNHFYAVRHEATEFSKIMLNNGHYAVQGHSRSVILVPIDSSYTTFY